MDRREVSVVRVVVPATLCLVLGALGCGSEASDDPASAPAAAVAALQGATQAAAPAAEDAASQLVLTISGGVLGDAPAIFTVPLQSATMTRSMFMISAMDVNAASADGGRKLVRFNLRSNRIDEGGVPVTEDRAVVSAQFDVDGEFAGDGTRGRAVRPVSGELVIERRSGGVLVGRLTGEGRSTNGGPDDVYRIDARFRTTYSTSLVPD